MTGRVGDPIETPISFGEKIFKTARSKLIKLESGAHHTLALTADGKVWGWGDAECGKIGRILRTRDKNQSALRIESCGAKNAIDVFCGAHTSFYKNKANQLFAWGLNNHG
jgi:RCC1 and BTB domain-containing protein